MKCPTKLCSGAIHRTEDWSKGKYCDFVKAICNHCNGLYWLIKRDEKYSFKFRKRDEVFKDHRDGRYR